MSKRARYRWDVRALWATRIQRVFSGGQRKNIERGGVVVGVLWCQCRVVRSTGSGEDHWNTENHALPRSRSTHPQSTLPLARMEDSGPPRALRYPPSRTVDHNFTRTDVDATTITRHRHRTVGDCRATECGFAAPGPRRRHRAGRLLRRRSDRGGVRTVRVATGPVGAYARSRSFAERRGASLWPEIAETGRLLGQS